MPENLKVKFTPHQFVDKGLNAPWLPGPTFISCSFARGIDFSRRNCAESQILREPRVPVRGEIISAVGILINPRSKKILQPSASGSLPCRQNFSFGFEAPISQRRQCF